MKHILLTSLIISFAFPIEINSQSIQIPVIPYNHKPISKSSNIHNLCKSFKNYTRCIKTLSKYNENK